MTATTHTLSIDFVTDLDPGNNSGTVSGALESLLDLTVDLDLTRPGGGYPSENVYVLRVDSDGDLVVCEIVDGEPRPNSTWAIPQTEIKRIRVPLGAAA